MNGAGSGVSVGTGVGAGVGIGSAVKRGVVVPAAQPQEQPKPEPKPQTEKTEPAEKAAEPPQPKAEEAPAAQEQPAPPTGPAPVTQETAAPQPVQPAQPTQTAQPAKNLEELYRNAKPFPQWVEVIEGLKPISRSISAAFVGSKAFESSGYLLIDSSNTMAFDLLRHSKRRQEIRDVIQEVTGKVYKLGPYRPPVKEQEKADPMQRFRESLADSGITVEES